MQYFFYYIYRGFFPFQFLSVYMMIKVIITFTVMPMKNHFWFPKETFNEQL